MPSGIYEIRNLKTQDFYIGSSSDLKNRKRHHFQYLNRGSHHNAHLQSSFNKHGADSFLFKTLILCDANMLVFYEQCLIDNLHPTYNKRLTAESNYGIKRSEEARKNISSAKMGIKRNISDEYREKLRASMVGNKFAKLIVYTDEIREKKRKSMMGKNVGKKPSQKCRDAVSLSNKTRVVTEETRRKMSVAQLARRRVNKESYERE